NERDIKKYVENILKRLDVSNDKMPNFYQVYLWQEFNYESDRLVVIYFPNRKLCYFVEELG
ncbi:hypothetical protein, partial [Paenibacillus helianthi]|uniref:hypothetical protein n=1 Tax=Paenibacillus helianthi TaxID=1349432 RepID=UPI001ABFEE18